MYQFQPVLPQNTNSPRLQHHGQRKVHRIAKPALGERAQRMPMGNKQYITWILSVHIACMDSTNFGYKTVDASSNLFRGPTSTVNSARVRKIMCICNLLSILATISPDIPRPGLIQTMFRPQRADLLGQQTFILAIIPLGETVRLRHLLRILELLLVGVIESQLKGMRRPPAGTDIDMCKFFGVNKSSGSHQDLARRKDLFGAVLCQLELADAGVPAAL